MEVTVVTRKWQEGIVYNYDNYFMEDDGDKEELKVERKKKIVRIPNRYNFYFKIKSNLLIRKLKIYKLFTFMELFLKWTNSVYFDNQDFSSYKDSEEGVTPRKKIRIRTYNKNFFFEEGQLFC